MFRASTKADLEANVLGLARLVGDKEDILVRKQVHAAVRTIQTDMRHCAEGHLSTQLVQLENGRALVQIHCRQHLLQGAVVEVALEVRHISLVIDTVLKLCNRATLL